MRNWCRFLPLAFVRWWALRNCEREMSGGRYVVNPLPGVLFTVPHEAPEMCPKCAHLPHEGTCWRKDSFTSPPCACFPGTKLFRGGVIVTIRTGDGR